MHLNYMDLLLLKRLFLRGLMFLKGELKSYLSAASFTIDRSGTMT